MKNKKIKIEFSRYLRKQIGERLTDAREKKGLYQKDVLIGNRPLANAIENGECLPRYTKNKQREKIITEKNFMTWKNAQNICTILGMNEEEFIFGRNDILDIEMDEKEFNVGENNTSEINLSDNVKWILEQIVYRNAKLYPNSEKEVTTISEFEKIFDDLLMFDGNLALLKKNFESQQESGWFDPLKENYQKDITHLAKEAKKETDIKKKRELKDRIDVLQELKRLSKNHIEKLSKEVEDLNIAYKERYKIVFNEFWKMEAESLVSSFKKYIVDQRFDEKKGFYTKRRVIEVEKDDKKSEIQMEVYRFSLLKLDMEIEDWLNREVKIIIANLKNEYLEDSTLNIGYQIFNLLELRNKMIIWKMIEESNGDGLLEKKMYNYYEETALNMIELQEEQNKKLV